MRQKYYLIFCCSGKIKYYTVPPEVDESNVHISSEIVTDIAKEFNIEEFENMETEILNNIEKECGTIKNSFVVESSGPVEAIENMEQDEEESDLVRKILCYGECRIHFCYFCIAW